MIWWLSTPCNGFNESSYRRRFWREVRGNRILTLIGGYRVELYLPIANWDDDQVERFIKEKGIPENPAWSFGWSFECLCMAGTTPKTLDMIIDRAPELARWLADKDKEVQASRKEPTYIFHLLPKRMTLHEYIEKKLKQPKLTQFITAHEEQNKRL